LERPGIARARTSYDYYEYYGIVGRINSKIKPRCSKRITRRSLPRMPRRRA